MVALATTSAWRDGAAGPGPGGRGGAAACAVPGGGGGAVVFGGADRSPEAFKDAWLLKQAAGGALAWERPAVRVAGGAALPPRTGATLTAVGAKLYLFGGQDPTSGACFNDVVALDPATWEWERLSVSGGSPPPRHSHTTCLVNGHCLLVFGGAGQASLLNDLWVFDTTTCAWTFPTFAGQCPAAREMHTATMVTPTDMLVFAGRNSLGTVLRDAVQLDVARMRWGRKVETDFPRVAHTAVAFPAAALGLGRGGDGAAVVVFGGFTGGDITDDVLVLEPGEALRARRMEVMQAGHRPGARFAHVAVPLAEPDGGAPTSMAVFGGVDAERDYDEVAVLELAACAPLVEELEN